MFRNHIRELIKIKFKLINKTLLIVEKIIFWETFFFKRHMYMYVYVFIYINSSESD